MGQENSTDRKVIIINPNSPETNEEYVHIENKTVKDHIKTKLVEELKMNSNTKIDISNVDKSLEKRNDFFLNRIKIKSGLKSEMAIERDEFYSKCQDLESYFCFKIDEAREYEEPCQKIKTTMTKCLSQNCENPLSCRNEVSNFIACLDKCKK